MRSGCENCWRRLEIPVAAGLSPSRSGMSCGRSPRLAGLVYMGKSTSRPATIACACGAVYSGFTRPTTVSQNVRDMCSPQPVLGGRHDRRLHHGRHPDVRRASDLEPEELARRDADDCERRSREVNRPADDGGFERKSPLPVAVADDGNRMAIRVHVVCGANGAPGHRVDAEELEVASRDQLSIGGWFDAASSRLTLSLAVP